MSAVSAALPARVPDPPRAPTPPCELSSHLYPNHPGSQNQILQRGFKLDGGSPNKPRHGFRLPPPLPLVLCASASPSRTCSCVRWSNHPNTYVFWNLERGRPSSKSSILEPTWQSKQYCVLCQIPALTKKDKSLIDDAESFSRQYLGFLVFLNDLR